MTNSTTPVEDAEAVYEWLREPDWTDDGFNVLEWLNRRPSGVAQRLVRALGGKA